MGLIIEYILTFLSDFWDAASSSKQFLVAIPKIHSWQYSFPYSRWRCKHPSFGLLSGQENRRRREPGSLAVCCLSTCSLRLEHFFENRFNHSCSTVFSKMWMFNLHALSCVTVCRRKWWWRRRSLFPSGCGDASDARWFLFRCWCVWWQPGVLSTSPIRCWG